MFLTLEWQVKYENSTALQQIFDTPKTEQQQKRNKNKSAKYSIFTKTYINALVYFKSQ